MNENTNPSNPNQASTVPPVAPATPAQVPVPKVGLTPTPAAVPTTAPAPAPAPVRAPGVNPVVANRGPVKPGTPGIQTRRPPSARNLLYWTLGCFGCSIVMLVLFVLIFVGQTNANGDNAIAKFLGIDTGTFINQLITLVNVLFGFFAIILLIIAVIGIFRAALAAKEDREARKRNVTLAGAAGLLLTFMILIWVGIYLFLSSRKVISPKTQTSVIVTDPSVTLGLTAPIVIKFDGTKLPISTGKYEILSFLWDFGDGNTSTLQSPSHKYADAGKNNGRFDVKLTVAVKDKVTGKEDALTYTDIVTIANVKINADFTFDPPTGVAPLQVSFDASGSSVPSGNIQSYDWDFDNKNTFTDASGVKATHTFEKIGTYKVNLRVTDDNGQFAVVTKEITVNGPNLPTADIQIPTTDGHYYVGTQYNFLGEKSSSPAGKITKYEWDFGDQSPKATTRTANHIFKQAGNYEVTLTVTDEKNNVGTDSQKILVETPTGALLAAFTTVPGQVKKDDGFISGKVPFEVNFDASSSSEANGSIVDYKWDFDGDGTTDASGKQVKYVYKDPGSYNAQLTVVDADNKTASTILVVKVAQQGIQARLTADPVEGVVPLTITFDASASSYPAGQIVSYEWDFGDGSPKRVDVSKVTYKYSQVGTFNVKVKTIGSDNTTSTATIPVNVRPVPLKACFDASKTQGPAPLNVDFDPMCSTGTIAKYNWDFGDNQTSHTRKPTHSFANPGSYAVKLEVADGQNVVDTFSMNILVTGIVP